MIYLSKMKEEDLWLILRWKKEEQYFNEKFEGVNNITMESQERWFDGIKNNEKCLYWIIQSSSLKIGIADINHIDLKNMKCDLECVIGDIHFRGRGLKQVIIYNLYEYAFNELGMNEVCRDVTSSNIYDFEKQNIKEICIQHKNDTHLDSLKYIKINKEIWEKIKVQYKKDKIKIS